jgi:hypothetical protein
LVTYTIQADEDEEADEGFEKYSLLFRSLLDKYSDICDSPLYAKLYKSFMYLLCNSVFSQVGLTMSKLQYARVEQEAMKRKYHLGPDFIHCMMDTILFLFERGQQFMRTGTFDSILHDGKSYEAWFVKTNKLKHDSCFLHNPEAHGFTIFSYLADLRDVIEQGKDMEKFYKSVDPSTKRYMGKILGEMQMLLSESISKRSAQQSRRAPFATLVCGGSSVGKSTFTDILFHYYGSLLGLPTDSEFMYTRNSIDPFWVNFNTTQWCVRMDDIAFLKPDKAPMGDPSLLEIIQLINSVPMVPMQAALEDKGRTPILAKQVIATTNTIDLNANHFFSCPLAVRRRLPIVLDIYPKPEYTSDGKTLDGSLVPETEMGAYPNLWSICVYKVIPHKLNKPNESQQAMLAQEEYFTDINDFLVWYAKAAKHYESIQEKEQNCKDTMKEIKLCKSCYKTISLCECENVQALEDGSEELIDGHEYMDGYHTVTDFQRSVAERCNDLDEYHDDMVNEPGIWNRVICWWCEKAILTLAFIFKISFRWRPLGDAIEVLSGFFIARMNDTQIARLFYRCGDNVFLKIGMCSRFKKIALACATVIGLYKVGAFAWGTIFCRDDDDDKVIQGNTNSKDIGTEPVAMPNERENVWYKDDFQVTSFDVSPVTSSMKGLGFTKVVSDLAYNCTSVTTFQMVDGEPKKKTTKGIFVSGHLCMFNNHGIPLLDNAELEFTSQCKGDGLSTNMRFKVVEKQVMRYPDKDLCFIYVTNMRPHKDITSLFMQETLRGIHKGLYVTRMKDGSMSHRNIANINSVFTEIKELTMSADIWWGQCEVPTVLGDCGSLMVSNSGMGPVILGLHTIGCENGRVGAIPVTQQFLSSIIKSMDVPFIQSGSPSLKSETVERTLSTLHYKSCARYIESGVAATYGSFTGFIPRPKSHVEPTIICESLKKRGYVLKHGRPVMHGWAPWRVALLDMTNPVKGIDQSILDHCVDSFTNDILGGLTTEDLKLVEVYDDLTTINGCPGVSYVDKINRGTSAGFPWNKSKKYYLEHVSPISRWMDPVMPTKEIMDRVDVCIGKYIDGERYMPVFSGHLKDEAVTFSKIARNKTRVFTGAPLDFTIVVRKYMLSFIRLMQNRRHLFESAPGTICQSLEWEEMYQYLTHFGDDRMIAGDYKAFDKSMPASIILAAFKIIYNVCKAAGYSKEDLKVVQGISEDISFPVVNFKGDLMEFCGSNPSGHPLTVVINGLANSLYLRYCYTILSPNRDCQDFQNNVHVKTFGDDNVMGVSPDIDFFTHTTIRDTLANVGIVYTMADKEAKSVPFLHINDISFLKRTWKYDHDVGAIVAPLEMDSIEKMLLINVVSKSIPQEAQMMSIFASAIREYFWHGKDIYNCKRDLFMELILEHELMPYYESYVLPPWEELKTAFWQASRHVAL